MDILKRSLAPMPAEAWEFIDREAKEVLQLKLVGRRVIDFVGPLGLEKAAVNTGRWEAIEKSPVEDVNFSKKLSLPLVELRVPFRLKLSEIEALARGAEDVDTDPLIDAVSKIAQAEDEAIFNGLEEVNMDGLMVEQFSPLTEYQTRMGSLPE